jgi:hypothetical protein
MRGPEPGSARTIHDQNTIPSWPSMSNYQRIVARAGKEARSSGAAMTMAAEGAQPARQPAHARGVRSPWHCAVDLRWRHTTKGLSASSAGPSGRCHVRIWPGAVVGPLAEPIQKQTFVGLTSTTPSAQLMMSALEGDPVSLMVPRAAQCDPKRNSLTAGSIGPMTPLRHHLLKAHSTI